LWHTVCSIAAQEACREPAAQEDRLAMKNIYVGNLSFQTTEQDLEAAFSAYGQVERAQLVKDRDTGKSRGFGFVEMTEDVGAERAIEALNGSQLDGRSLTVNEARPRESRPAGGGGNRFGGNSGGGGGGDRSRRREPRW
jgi:cold-inducible RNA-binding protein